MTHTLIHMEHREEHRKRRRIALQQRTMILALLGITIQSFNNGYQLRVFDQKGLAVADYWPTTNLWMTMRTMIRKRGLITLLNTLGVKGVADADMERLNQLKELDRTGDFETLTKLLLEGQQ